MPPELVVAIVIRLPLDRVGDREQMRGGRRLRRRVLLNRLEMVEDPQRPAVRRHDEVVVARMQRDLIHADARAIRLPARPRPAAIDREEQPGLAPSAARPHRWSSVIV